MKRLKEIFKDDSAQGMLEYVIILALVVMVGLVFKDKIKGFILGGTDAVTSQSSSLFSTGGGN